jgi:hypothetical protein
MHVLVLLNTARAFIVLGKTSTRCVTYYCILHSSSAIPTILSG